MVNYAGALEFNNVIEHISIGGEFEFDFLAKIDSDGYTVSFRFVQVTGFQTVTKDLVYGSDLQSVDPEDADTFLKGTIRRDSVSSWWFPDVYLAYDRRSLGDISKLMEWAWDYADKRLGGINNLVANA